MDLQALVTRYDKPGPRYTSYPTVPVWSEAFGDAELREALARSTADDLSLYVHVPYCERLCSFCACNRQITQDHGVVAPYLEAIGRQAGQLAAGLGRERRAVQLAFGGGSPNFLDEQELGRLIDTIDEHFAPAPDAERSAELDPRRTRPSQLDVLAERRFTRVSFGVQDTDPRVLRAINRVQSEETIRELVRHARSRGIRSVNVDLIYGLPYQTVESFQGTLDRLEAIRPDRIALYSYAHVTWISKAQRGFERKDLPDAQEKVAIFLAALSRLESAGYRHLGLDHFALPDDELVIASDDGTLRRNFMGYTTRGGVEVLALGPSGISEIGGSYAQSAHDPDAWRESIAQGALATVKGFRLSPEDRERGWLIQRLMCRGEIRGDRFEETFGRGLAERIPDLDGRLAPFVEDGLLTRTDHGYEVTRTGRLFLRVIAMTFDAHLKPPGEDQPRFSRTV